MEAVASGAAHRRWETSGRSSQYSLRMSNLAKDGAQFVIAHVHCPAQMIPMMGTKIHYTRLDPEQVKDHRKMELEKASGRLDEYVVLCALRKVSCEKIIIENDDVARGLEELITLHGITKLVMGAASDKYYSKYETESQQSKKEVFEESSKRRKAELDLLSALQKAKELEKLYHHELRQRKTIEEALSIQRREMEETRVKCETLYEELHDAGEEHVILEQCITEVKSARDDEKQKLAASKNFVEELRADKEKLQQERDATAEELRQTKKEQRVSVPAAEAVINTEFSASELEQATRSFDEALKIGEGGFGCVYRGSLRSTGPEDRRDGGGRHGGGGSAVHH
ncbi:U-box domain-containing protein 33-like [Lolium rigidum]|uniref:U-box domain-containing protein 33-like n=1 Tax=Lolium rigidum TaxID=89674 RepID=UPI001F5CE3C2|nr:U-box domain-containing protein 33-like [Lolium rigidum]